MSKSFSLGRGVRRAAWDRLWAFAAMCVVACLIAAPARAGPVSGYAYAGSFSQSGSGQGDLSAPGHIAVEPGTGNLLVADSGNGRVEVFSPDSGPTASYLTEFGGADISHPWGVAVDPTNGDVYVSGSDATTPKIAKYRSDGAPVPTYTRDLTFTSPAGGSGPGQIGSFDAGIAVDPVTHDLLVADPGDNGNGNVGNNRISRYSSSGTFIDSFDGAGTAGAFTQLADVAVGPDGTTYAVDIVADNTFGTGSTRIVHFDASDHYADTEAAADLPAAAAVNQVQNTLLAGVNNNINTAPAFNTYSQGTLVESTAFDPGSSGSSVPGIAVDPTVKHRAYAVTGRQFFDIFGVEQVEVFAMLPAVEIDPTTNVTSRSADFHGIVNPEDTTATAHFDYTANGVTKSTTDAPVGSDATDHAVTEHVTGLSPNSDYSVRLVVSDGTHTSVSGVTTFHTDPEPPAVSNSVPADLGQTSASLTGTVDPWGKQTTYYFEWGTSNDYGHRVPMPQGVAGDGYTDRFVTYSLSGLEPSTTYHYRLVATSSEGTTYGPDTAFTTIAALTASAYEMVSPVQKNAVPVDDKYSGIEASPDGNQIVYTSAHVSFPGSESTTYLPRVLATRGGNGWANLNLDPPVIQLSSTSDVFYGVIAVSDDMKRALAISRRALAPGAVEGNGNLYIKDIPTNTYRLVATSADPNFYGGLSGVEGSKHYIGASSDMHTVVFASNAPLTPESQPVTNIYSWSDAHGLQLVSVMPDGTPATQGSLYLQENNRIPNLVSQDGSRILFSLDDQTVYMRIDGTRTIPVSISQRAGDPAGPYPAVDTKATSDGRFVMFRTRNVQGLTADAPDNAANFYRYDVDQDQLRLVATSADTTLMALPATGDLYFGSDTALGNATGPDPYFYYEHDGVIRMVASGAGSGQIAQATVWQASPNGRYFAFISPSNVNGLNASGRLALYAYSADADRLTCLSCRSDGGSSMGVPQLGQAGISGLGHYFPRAVLDNGTVFFDTPDPLVPGDVNGARDVYGFQNGRLWLVTPGTGNYTAGFAEATPDGKNVFFTTDEQLVGQDQDNTVDLYDARTGGGFAAQSPLPGNAPCGGTECREPSSGPVVSDPAPSQQAGTKAAGTTTRATKPKVTLIRSTVGKTSVTLLIQVSDRGRIRASGGTVTATSKTVSKAGNYTLRVPLTRKTRSARAHHKRVKLAIKVALTPPFADAVSTKLTRTLGK